MLIMEDSTKDFLKNNLPDSLNDDRPGDVLDRIYDWIDLQGFGPDSLYNQDGKAAQATYDVLYYSNRKSK